MGPYLGQIEDKREVDGKPLFSQEKENVCAPKRTCTKLFIAALFIKSKLERTQMSNSSRINKSLCIHAMEYYRMIFLKKGKNKILHHVPLIY